MDIVTEGALYRLARRQLGYDDYQKWIEFRKHQRAVTRSRIAAAARAAGNETRYVDFQEVARDPQYLFALMVKFSELYHGRVAKLDRFNPQ